MIKILLTIIGIFGLGFSVGAIYAYLDCVRELNRRLADGRLVERV